MLLRTLCYSARLSFQTGRASISSQGRGPSSLVSEEQV